MQAWNYLPFMSRHTARILSTVMNMKTSKELLSSILKTTQMGQVGIHAILDTPMRPALRKALQSQLREYDSIETQAHALATQRGWELPELQSIARWMAGSMVRARVHGGDTDSKIAGMMIQGNTRGMITGLKNVHEHQLPDEALGTLAQTLIDCENANIRQMQPFL